MNYSVRRKDMREDKKEIEVDENTFALCQALDRLSRAIEESNRRKK